MNPRDAALIQRALEALPEQCKYHRDKVIVDYGLCGDGSCCDTGRPSMYRRFAEEALQRVTAPPEEPKAVRWRREHPHAHVCLSCAPTANTPGPGCINCRQSGMDQTPCTAEGHNPQCPHGCCPEALQRAVGK